MWWAGKGCRWRHGWSVNVLQPGSDGTLGTAEQYLDSDDGLHSCTRGTRACSATVDGESHGDFVSRLRQDSDGKAKIATQRLHSVLTLLTAFSKGAARNQTTARAAMYG